ncbi:MAG: flagellar protein export ATPase FliI [Rhodobiaceae bacterium]|nr:flagellar protein export ATPase FliI [Rhodobiaceae bacterium]
MVVTGEGHQGTGRLEALIDEIRDVAPVRMFGRVQAVRGLLVEVAGPVHAMALGSRVDIEAPDGGDVRCEVVGFRDERALCMPYGALEGVRLGCAALYVPSGDHLRPDNTWLGRVINGFGEPMDGGPPMPSGSVARNIKAPPPPAHLRGRVGDRIDLGIRALNTFATTCRGQRMGIFAGSGVGKSVLFSMLARNTACDVAVIGLIGERGREVQEFIDEHLGESGLKRSVVVVATSDESPLMRRRAAYTTLTVAEYFRDQGKNVLCLMDSVTRFAMAQREIGLAGGEPPTTKGYTPTVFSELPRLLERAGPGTNAGSITGIFTVLVEGDDHNEPVSDAVRGILDGHIVMERSIAERGRFPAINVLRSVSRTMPGCVEPERRPLVTEARKLLAAYDDVEELVRIGAYRRGADKTVDRAIALMPDLEAFLSQGLEETATFDQGYDRLAEILATEAGNPGAD